MLKFVKINKKRFFSTGKLFIIKSYKMFSIKMYILLDGN